MVANLVLILPRGFVKLRLKRWPMPLGENEDPTALRTSLSKSKSSIKGKKKRKKEKKKVILN